MATICEAACNTSSAPVITSTSLPGTVDTSGPKSDFSRSSTGRVPVSTPSWRSEWLVKNRKQDGNGMKEDPPLGIADEADAGPALSVIVPCYNERPNVAPMIARLDAALCGIDWEVIYVDDNSPDATSAEVRGIARTNPRVRCIRRVGRRGLASAVIEGALSSSAAYMAVIDGDLQHDETRLPVMLAELRSGYYDLAVASRHAEGGNNCSDLQTSVAGIANIGGSCAR